MNWNCLGIRIVRVEHKQKSGSFKVTGTETFPSYIKCQRKKKSIGEQKKISTCIKSIKFDAVIER